MGYNIKIKSIDLTGFRGFKEKVTIDLGEDLIVFIGDNGSGKTGILDAIAYQLMNFRYEITDRKMFTFPIELHPKRLKNYDVNNESEKLVNNASFTLEFPNGDIQNVHPIIRAKKNSTANVEDWDDDKNDEFSERSEGSIVTYAYSIYNNKLEQKLSNIPVLIYYGGDSINTEIEDDDQGIELIQMDIFDTYRQSLEAKEFNFTQFMLLLDRQQKIRLQHPDKRNFITYLEAALTTILSDDGYIYQNLRIEWGDRFDEMIMDKVGKDGYVDKLVINQLSSGERNLLALIGDLTRRLFLANQVGNPLHGNGIVLIDEIDVHLHPKWQRKVVKKLREIFPNIQFVVTTHSPLVISAFEPKHIRILFNNNVINADDKNQPTKGLQPNRILKELMSTPLRDFETQEKIKQLRQYIKEDFESEKVQKLLNELTLNMGRKDPFIMRVNNELLMLRRRKRT